MSVIFLAGVVRIELTPEESEASVLPLHHTPVASVIIHPIFANCNYLTIFTIRYSMFLYRDSRLPTSFLR